MSEQIAPQAPSIDLSATSSLIATGSPKGMYVFFLLSICKNYFEVMRSGTGPNDIEAATAALVAFCPNRAKRKELWEQFATDKDKDGSNPLSASVLCVGELISYLSDTLEFEESSTGGLM